MSVVFNIRLMLDLLALGLFIVALAYWWLNNISHEVIGTAMFVLLILHNVFNRWWYSALPKTRRAAKSLVTLVLNFTLLATMVTLLTTSVLISQSLFRDLAFGGATARDIHILAAYWALVIVSIHLGLHWSIVMNTLRGLLVIRQSSWPLQALMRAAAVAVAAYGVLSSLENGIGSKLILVPTMQFWDFNENTIGFFIQHASIVGLFAVVAHYLMIALPSRKKRNSAYLGTSGPTLERLQ